MQQKNEKFIAILNRMCTNTRIGSKLAYINRNCKIYAPKDPTFPCIFYRNKNVATHNKNMLLVIPSEEIVTIALDEEDLNAMEIHLTINIWILYHHNLS